MDKSVKVSGRSIFFSILAIVFIGLLIIERAILTPFIIAAIFAYIFNPVIDFFSNKIRLPRTISIIIVYLFITVIVVGAGILLSRRIISESSDFSYNIKSLVETTKIQAANLPDWLLPTVEDTLDSLEKSKVLAPGSVFALFPQAISRIVSFLIFLFSAFYFLKEGRGMIDKLLHLIPKDNRIDAEVLIRKMNLVFNSYLRGQLFMVALISLILFIALSILGVRYALILAVFSGFAEIVPIIGPITAAGVAVAVITIADISFNFGLSQIQAAIAVIIIYFIVRQIQDYFIAPHVMGKVTNLHPLIILFSVLAGGHLFGILGFILAVPIAASIRLILQFVLDKLST